jgi:tetratricopeptide (TPR) repeat protein
MADVFLSYARANANKAAQVAQALRDQGYSLWFDESLPAHRAYSDVIEEQLNSAAAVLVLWSADAVRSQWVRSEANRARETGRLVQARLDGATLPMPFDQIQCADLARWKAGSRSSAWATIVGSIAALAGGGREASLPTSARPPTVGRRAVLVAGGALGVAAVGGAWLWTRGGQPHPTNPEAALLFQKGTDILQNNDVFAANDPGSLNNAIALLTDATEADPNSATGWGALAMAYAALKRVSPASRRAGLEARSRSAANTALELEPHEPRATSALLLLDPVYRNWSAAERADRNALEHSPPIPILLFLLSETLGSVGRWREAATFSIKFDRKRFIIPGADRRVIVDVWSAGDLAAADAALKLAVEHWPQQLQVWRTRLAYLMYSGRPSEALTILHDRSERPANVPDGLLEAVDATARALAGEGAAASATEANLAYLKANPEAIFGVVHACAALGDARSAFAILDGYYFNQGEWASVAPAAGDADRETSALFQPPMRNVWRDPRFDRLLQRIGLNEYWRRSRTVPDFRRG